MTLTGAEKTTCHLHRQILEESHMQLVIIIGGIVSTCRGRDRQTHQPHISTQLEVRRN